MELKANNTRQKFKNFASNYTILMMFIIFCIIMIFASEYFATWRNIRNILRQTSINGLLSIGMTFVILTGGIDLSVGSVLAFGGVVSASLVSKASGGEIYSPTVAIMAAMGVGIIMGAITGILVAKWKVAPFVASLGMLSVARGLTYIYTDGMPIPKIDRAFLFIGKGSVLGLPMPVFIFAIVVLISYIVLKKTRYGRYIYAVGGNEQSARISGINTKLIIFSVYVISGLLAAFGGAILTARTTAGLPQAGQSYELDAIAAVVIGGTSLKGGQGSLVGTVIGALIIGVVNNGLDILGVSSYYQQVVKGSIIVIAVLIDSIKKKN